MKLMCTTLMFACLSVWVQLRDAHNSCYQFLSPVCHILLLKLVVSPTGKFRREFKRTFLQCRCLYNTTSSPSRTGHFNNRVSTAREHPMTATVTPGSKRARCYMPSSTTSPVRHQGRRHLSTNNETSSNRLWHRLLVSSSGSSLDYGNKHRRVTWASRESLSAQGQPVSEAFNYV
jgi:hypothetical protein